jgi:acetolactate synthase-1/2/3 large subunit
VGATLPPEAPSLVGTVRISNRKKFLTGVAVGGAAMLAPSAAPTAAAAAPAPPAAAPLIGGPAGEARLAAADASPAVVDDPMLTVTDAGSDFMVDVIKSLDLEYVALNPGGSIRGLHESIIHYGGNVKPQLISVMHEEIGVAMAHGYARASGKPMMALIYGVLGLQHASEAVYNAYVDRVPVVMFAGNVSEQSKRFGLPSWYHSATDLAPLLAGAVKWSDQPTDATYVADSFHKAYRMAVTAPGGPVLVTLDDWIQESSVSAIRSKLTIPAYHAPVPPVGDPRALADAAKLLVAAQYPVIVADRTVSGQAGMDRLGELATLLGAPVLNGASRICLPTDHPCNLTGAETPTIARADALLFLGVDDVWGTLNRVPDTVSRSARRIAKPDATVISLAIDDYSARGNLQDQQHATDVDLPIIGDPEATLPYLIDAVRSALGGAANDRIAQRAAEVKRQHAAMRARAIGDAAIGWDASPVNLARLTAELGSVMGHRDTTVVTNSSNFLSSWPQRLWDITRWNQFQMNSGAGGLGFTTPSAIGAALANRRTGLTTIAFQTDGDFMYVNSSLWTMAHHKIPVMVVMHNNRAYHAEHMNIQTMANRRQRQVNDTGLGTTIVDPPIDYAMMARSMGVEGIGPIADSASLRSALERGRDIVKRGEPVLIDVVTQPR